MVGGGVAGLSAAVTLGRALRTVLVVDSGEPRNAPADGVHGYLTREGMNPLALQAAGRIEAESYGATVVRAEAVSLRPTTNGFEVGLGDGRRVTGRRLLLTTGLADRLPNITGLQEQWGKGVVHCPYCHGYEIRHQQIGVLGTGPMSVHQTFLFRQWSDDITLFLNDTVAPTEDEMARLAARSVRVVEGVVESVDNETGLLTGVTLSDGTRFELQALAVATRMEARANLLEPLGLQVAEHPLGAGHFIEADPTGATSVDGVYVAGNISNLAAQVIVAAAEGTTAATAINAGLIEEETALAVRALRKPSPTGRKLT
ncbi:NAD(P)/FAD-dependent oxidoreductase [Paenarthrobacter sp. NPDC089322]|uniref:NAD(P)/FAD-dependent oxidoreductase n=1 Tax=Paenarthrobacter sp. NPDC089322 TaxID=3155065 RepID=UPI0034453D01